MRITNKINIACESHDIFAKSIIYINFIINNLLNDSCSLRGTLVEYFKDNELYILFFFHKLVVVYLFNKEF